MFLSLKISSRYPSRRFQTVHSFYVVLTLSAIDKGMGIMGKDMGIVGKALLLAHSGDVR